MKRLGTVFVALAVLLTITFGLAGCEKKAPEPPPEQAKQPPEPTPEEIAGKIEQTALGAISADMAQGELSPAARQAFVAAIGSARTTNQNTENGLKALDMIASKLGMLTQGAKEKKQWTVVLACAEAYEVLQPGSTKMARLKEQATREANKPRVKLRGFMVDNAGNRTYALMTLTIPATGQVKDVQAAEGDEFEGLRFVKVVGDQRGIELELKDAPGESFQVMKGE